MNPRGTHTESGWKIRLFRLPENYSRSIGVLRVFSEKGRQRGTLRSLKSKPHCKQMGVQPNIERFEVAIGKMPKPVTEIYRFPIGQVVFDAGARLQNELEGRCDFERSFMPVADGQPSSREKKRRPFSFRADKLIFQLERGEPDQVGGKRIHFYLVAFRVQC